MTAVAQTTDELPLSLAAQRLGLSWPQTMRLVHTREIGAEWRRGRWYLAAADVERVASRR